MDADERLSKAIAELTVFMDYFNDGVKEIESWIAELTKEIDFIEQMTAEERHSKGIGQDAVNRYLRTRLEDILECFKFGGWASGREEDK